MWYLKLDYNIGSKADYRLLFKCLFIDFMFSKEVFLGNKYICEQIIWFGYQSFKVDVFVYSLQISVDKY